MYAFKVSIVKEKCYSNDKRCSKAVIRRHCGVHKALSQHCSFQVAFRQDEIQKRNKQQLTLWSVAYGIKASLSQDKAEISLLDLITFSKAGYHFVYMI